ncbi:M23 family metallopeptidase [Neobacillus drentensis]|uniref:M23 family metallopeptidase n=1 Tax=Neobacillus drentensis TaxID=220684 RepID=UPI002FFF173C
MAYIYCKNPFTGKRIEEGSTLPEDQVEIIAPCGHGPGAKDIRFPGIQYRKAFLGHYRSGSPIYAMQTGKVRYLRRDSVHCPEGAPCPNNDNMVLIEAYGSAGYYTGYHHVKPIPELQEGMEVEAGQMIGHIDSSGRTSTPHLHLARYTPGDSATWW